MSLDVTNIGNIRKVRDDVAALTSGKLDILVNNACVTLNCSVHSLKFSHIMEIQRSRLAHRRCIFTTYDSISRLQRTPSLPLTWYFLTFAHYLRSTCSRQWPWCKNLSIFSSLRGTGVSRIREAYRASCLFLLVLHTTRARQRYMHSEILFASSWHLSSAWALFCFSVIFACSPLVGLLIRICSIKVINVSGYKSFS